MPTVYKTDQYEAWFASLRDVSAKARINARVRRLELGNPGDAAAVGKGVSEMKIDVGPGYRIYYKALKLDTFLILCGGDKGSQQRDIRRAFELAGEWR